MVDLEKEKTFLLGNTAYGFFISKQHSLYKFENSQPSLTLETFYDVNKVSGPT